MSMLIITIIFGFFIGIALSIDAFVLSLIYGVTLKGRREMLFTSFLVGLFHFFMPLIGYFTTLLILKNFFSIPLIQSHFKNVATLILILLGFIMIFKKEEKNENYSMSSLFNKLLFSLSVSIDSLFVGIALIANNKINILLFSLTIFFVSFTITMTAFLLIFRVRNLLKIQNLTVLAGVILVIIGFISLMIS